MLHRQRRNNYLLRYILLHKLYAPAKIGKYLIVGNRDFPFVPNGEIGIAKKLTPNYG